MEYFERHPYDDAEGGGWVIYLILLDPGETPLLSRCCGYPERDRHTSPLHDPVNNSDDKREKSRIGNDDPEQVAQVCSLHANEDYRNKSYN